MEAKSNLNAADASRVNASRDAMHTAIKLLPKLGDEGLKACAALQNGTEFLLALIKLQTRALAAANAHIEQLQSELVSAEAHIDELENEVGAAMEAVMTEVVAIEGAAKRLTNWRLGAKIRRQPQPEEQYFPLEGDDDYLC